MSVVDPAKKVGVVLEVNAETDFVAKNAQFVEFVNNIAKTIIDNNPANLEELNTHEMRWQRHDSGRRAAR